MISNPTSGISQAYSASEPRTVLLRQRAEELESVFLSEMLGHAGLGPMKGSFSGGSGEDQFSSFLRNEQAQAIVRSGGIGLSEILFQAMQKADGKNG